MTIEEGRRGGGANVRGGFESDDQFIHLNNHHQPPPQSVQPHPIGLPTEIYSLFIYLEVESPSQRTVVMHQNGTTIT